ncbi:MAG: ComF family protein [Methylococcaceae bacterium]|nr:ComF family protein [Methylococcaceae bacterium]
MPINHLRTILDKLPSSCILCDNRGIVNQDICSYCLAALLKNKVCCYQCGIALEQLTNSRVCGDCQSRPPAFERSYAPFIYHGAMRYLISTLKFNNHYKNARLLGQLLAETAPKTELPQCIIPIPLHKSRYRQRGFNQCIEIAKTVSKQLQIPVDNSLCIRHKNTPHQIGLAMKERRKNVKNAFSMIKKPDYDHIAILDDVMTTGSTMREIAAVFQKSGVSKIDVWVCARA